MWRIKRVKFINHPVLGDLQLDFCKNGRPVDTVIIAGENGVGKTAILESLYKITSRKSVLPCETEFMYEHDGVDVNVKYSGSDSSRLQLVQHLDTGRNYAFGSDEEKQIMSFGGIYSSVEVNFVSRPITSVTSLELDSDDTTHRERFSDELSTHVKQLLVDIQALDDADVVQYIKSNPDLKCKDVDAQPRISRFRQAFASMFSNLNYNHIANENGQKIVYFNKNGVLVPIDSLSSGEKQIVYRGCYLLKNKNALNDAFIFIDEPEISLHPLWQKKILNYYKAMSTNGDGTQMSQIFAATHSPFIIHNKYRYNDKVIVLSSEGDEIVVNDKPSYYTCDTVTAVEDAFDSGLIESGDKSVVYLEGPTDELYFNKTAAVFDMELPFDFKWIGYKDGNGNNVNTGVRALNAAASYLSSHNPNFTVVCLFDSDANKPDYDHANVHVRSLGHYESSVHMLRGIENALVLDGLDIAQFYSYEDKISDYGEPSRIGKFDKKGMCDYICSLGDDELKTILINLKKEIDKISDIFQTGNGM